jgi:tetratricopeptide (TPR) repeat protein
MDGLEFLTMVAPSRATDSKSGADSPAGRRSHHFVPLHMFVLVLLFSIAAYAPAFAQSNDSSCGPIQNAYGPFDYRTDRDKLPVVEIYHFKPETEALLRGEKGEFPGNELDYVLRAFPNHHRALIAMTRLGEMLKSAKPYGARYSIDCYFERALRFRPDDAIVRMLYAKFLVKNARESEAQQQLERVSVLAGEDAFTHYNLGLIYFDMKNYDKALVQAHRASELGFPRPDLQDELKAAGKWKDPEQKTAPAPEQKQ